MSDNTQVLPDLSGALVKDPVGHLRQYFESVREARAAEVVSIDFARITDWTRYRIMPEMPAWHLAALSLGMDPQAAYPSERDSRIPPSNTLRAWGEAGSVEMFYVRHVPCFAERWHAVRENTGKSEHRPLKISPDSPAVDPRRTQDGVIAVTMFVDFAKTLGWHLPPGFPGTELPEAPAPADPDWQAQLVPLPDIVQWLTNQSYMKDLMRDLSEQSPLKKVENWRRVLRTPAPEWVTRRPSELAEHIDRQWGVPGQRGGGKKAQPAQYDPVWLALNIVIHAQKKPGHGGSRADRDRAIRGLNRLFDLPQLAQSKPVWDRVKPHINL